ncbi:MAG: dockerin type I domain-containing protein [Candidatus Zixiibacteriota bacterium]
MATTALSAAESATDGTHSLAAAAIDTTVRYQIHENGRFRATVTNWGYFGTFNFALVDSGHGEPTTVPWPAPAFESPPRSRVEYLYEAGLWIGGIVDGDTLVSTGTLGEWTAHELYPAGRMGPVGSDALGDEEFTFVYSDTATDPGRVPRDSYDGRHRPLPVTVRQTTRLVDDSSFAQGLIIELTVTNIGDAAIENLWLGWMVDPDVMHDDRDLGYLDDLTGHRQAAITLEGQRIAVSAAWAADNDGDPDSSLGAFDDRSTTGTFASMYLGGSPQLSSESYNWWISAVPRNYDWGPQRAPGDTNGSGGRGRLLGDAMRYRRMANREIDYDQVFAAVDRSAQGWVAPPPTLIAVDYANGYDTRFLHTVGAVTLWPGDSVTAAWAWVVSPRWHADPGHFAGTFDAIDPQAYLHGLNMHSLDTALARMQILWDNGFTPATVGPPRGLTIAGWDDSTASLRWVPRRTARLDGYEILRSTDSLHFDDRIAMLPRDDSASTDTGLERLVTYYYTIRSLDNRGRPGMNATMVGILPDRPMTPADLSAHRGNREIRLTWEPAEEPDVVGHRVYRLDTAFGWQPVGETADQTSFVDRSVDNAIVYSYRVAAISALGSESFPTAPIHGIALAFDGPPLVIDQTPAGTAALTDKDSVSAVWRRLLGSLGTQYRDADPTRTAALALNILDPHPAAIAVADGVSGLTQSTIETMALYAYAGGITICAGRNLFNTAQLTEGLIAFGPGQFPYDAFGITMADYPRVLLSHPTRLNAEFVGARAVDPRFGDLSVDSSRTDWGLNPVLPATEGAVGFVGWFDIDTSRAQVLYAFQSRDSASSPMQGRPVAVISRDERWKAAAFSFPLSYIREEDAAEALLATLQALGWRTHRPGDADGDNVVTVADVQHMVRHLFGPSFLHDPANADVNADCRVDILDAVVLINFLWRGGTEPLPGCASERR